MKRGSKDGSDDSFSFCPNPKCSYHDEKNIPKDRKWYNNHGYYYSLQHGKVARFVCLKCKKTYSVRTYDENRYLHFDSFDVKEIGSKYYDGEPKTMIARKMGISAQMVRTRLKRYNPFRDGLFKEWGELADSGDSEYGKPGGEGINDENLEKKANS